MKKLIAFCLMCMFAFAFTAVRASDTSPGVQKFSIEKTTLQAPPVFVVLQQVPEAPVSLIASPQGSCEQPFLYSNFLEKKNLEEIYHSPGWLVRNNRESTAIIYRGKIFIPARLIPYSRDRS